LVDGVVMSMQYLADTTLVLGVDASLEHVVSHPIQPIVEEVVVPMQYSVDPTLLLESDKYKEVTSSIQYLANPTIVLGGDAYFGHFHRISSYVPYKQWGIPLSPSPRMVSFYWNDIVEPHLPSSTPFHIMGLRQCILDEVSYESIISSSTWKYLGSPKLVLATSALPDFDRRPTWEPWPPLMVPSNIVFPIEPNIVICETSISGICDFLRPGFMDVELPLDEAILEAMILDSRLPLELKTLKFDYQIIPWPGPRNGPYLEN
jgi:hypothetical protein